MRRWRTVAWALSVPVIAAAIGASGVLAGCGEPARPLTASREVLGTAISVTVWGTDEAAIRDAVDAAFSEMATVEAALDPYDATSTVGIANADPYEWHRLPPEATEILETVEGLDLGEQFSPALFGVTSLYDFGGVGSVPDTLTVSVALAQARTFAREGARARFTRPAYAPPPPGSTVPTGAAALAARLRPGLDFGGASKGLALDRAVARLRRAPGVGAVLITAGSSTVAWGAKPDGTPWRIGIEDPRKPGTSIAVISGAAASGDPVNVSTSGDYQLFFERGGVRYHHLLDPATGRPARGLRSLTVYGRMSALEADVLSTALFVMGPTGSATWARRNGVGLYAVDERGRAISVSPPGGDQLTFERVAQPTP